MPSCVKITMIVCNVILCVFGLTIGIMGVVFYHKRDLAGSIEDHETFGGIDPADRTVLLNAAIFGFLLFVVSFIGFAGAAFDSVCALVLYIVIVTILMIGCLGIAILGLLIGVGDYHADTIDKLVDEIWVDRINRYRRDPNDTKNKETVDAVQMRDSCCGCHNYTDYNVTTTMQLPPSCFLMGEPLLGTPYPVGCCKILADKLYVIVKPYFTAIGVIALVGVLIEIAAIIFACVACSSLRSGGGGGGGGGPYR